MGFRWRLLYHDREYALFFPAVQVAEHFIDKWAFLYMDDFPVLPFRSRRGRGNYKISCGVKMSVCKFDRLSPHTVDDVGIVEVVHENLWAIS